MDGLKNNCHIPNLLKAFFENKMLGKTGFLAKLHLPLNFDDSCLLLRYTDKIR